MIKTNFRSNFGAKLKCGLVVWSLTGPRINLSFFFICLRNFDILPPQIIFDLNGTSVEFYKSISTIKMFGFSIPHKMNIKKWLYNWKKFIAIALFFCCCTFPVIFIVVHSFFCVCVTFIMHLFIPRIWFFIVEIDTTSIHSTLI